MAFDPGKNRNFIASLKRTMEAAWYGADVSPRAQVPDILNGEFLIGVNAAGNGVVNMLGVDATNTVVLPSGAPLAALVVTLTAAQLIAMNGAPVPIIAAPAANKAIVVRDAVFEMIPGTVAFTGGGAISLVYHGTSTPVHAGSVPAAVVTSASPGVIAATQLGPAVASNGTTAPVATGIDITNATAAFAAGNGTAKVHIWYHIITF